MGAVQRNLPPFGREVSEEWLCEREVHRGARLKKAGGGRVEIVKSRAVESAMPEPL
ncbi:hypothetical protein SAMCFNEI73_pC0647 (plasmid) [Sinorhizobium americanum]|uniref:Uncharacterized protein n=1 Tax=Sinorhizobium americanum TaxID=194963 RepID=A0A1L3LW89_9HYPH|nr:hypothetical protein SAMCFNEI73_pC0647 [Sinorhizobium americanum]